MRVRIAGVSGRQTGSLERHLAGALTLRQAGRGDGIDDHFGDSGGNDGTLVTLESQPLASGRHRAGGVALGGDRGAFTSRGTDTTTAIEDQTFEAWMTGNAGALTDQILVTSFVIRVDHVSDFLVAPFKSCVAQAFVTFADEAVNTSVSAAGDG